MIPLEYEGKKLLQMAGANVPEAVLTSDLGWDSQRLPAVVKAQTPFGKRQQQGGIRFAQTPGEVKRAVSYLLRSKFMGFTVEQVLVEDKISLRSRILC